MSDEIETEIVDLGNQHAEDVDVTPVGDIDSETAQDALEELDAKKTPLQRMEDLELIVARILLWLEDTFEELPDETEDFLDEKRGEING